MILVGALVEVRSDNKEWYIIAGESLSVRCFAGGDRGLSGAISRAIEHRLGSRTFSERLKVCEEGKLSLCLPARRENPTTGRHHKVIRQT